MKFTTKEGTEVEMVESILREDDEKIKNALFANAKLNSKGEIDVTSVLPNQEARKNLIVSIYTKMYSGKAIDSPEDTKKMKMKDFHEIYEKALELHGDLDQKKS